MLSLVLLQSRSYADIAALLHLDEEDVRKRAHTAAAHLVASEEMPSEDAQARIIDFVLGEQTVSERSDTRALLEDNGVARAWATQLVDGLAPLAKGELPAIPRDAPPREPETPRPKPRPHAPRPPRPATPSPPPRRVAATARPPVTSQGRRWLPGRTWLAPLGILAVAVVIVVLEVSSSSGSKPDSASSKGMVAQLVLRPTSAASSAGGSATVVHHQGGLLLQLRGHGLPANTRADSYAVWLYNSQSEALLLGFVNPPVGRSGSFANGVTLPADANRFHAVVVTIETVSQPSVPGKIVLRGPLELS